MDNRVTAEQAMAHGAAIQRCLNGALMSVQAKNGKWEPFTGGWEYFSFSSDFAYRTKANPSAPVEVSPATTDGIVGRDVPDCYAGKSFSFEAIKAHGEVIQYFLRGGSIQYRADDGEAWGATTSGGFFEFLPTSQYRVAIVESPQPVPGEGFRLLTKGEDIKVGDEFYRHGVWIQRTIVTESQDYSPAIHYPHRRRTGPHPVENCACEICSDERTQEVAAYAKQKMETLAPPPFVGQTVPKPPLGCEPEYIWVEKRIAELRSAVSRQIMYSSAENINWRLVANWSAEILERKEQLEGINRRPKAA